MQALRERTGNGPAGRKLLQLLQTVPNRDELAHAVVTVLAEVGPHREDGGGPDDAAATQTPMPAALSTIPDMQCITPRGKFDIALFEDRLLIDSPKQSTHVPYAAILSVIILDRIPKDTKGRVLLCLHLDKDAHIMNGKTALSCILLQSTAKAVLDIPNPVSSGRLQGPTAVVLSSVLGLLGAPSICAPSLDVFRTSSNEPGVAANIKASTGFLYPLRTGLCFVERPVTFIPAASISSVEFLRAGGGSATFDFYVHTKGGGGMEFGQLPQEELPAVAAYVQQQRLAVGAPPDDETDAEEEEEEEGTGEEFDAAGSAPASGRDGASGGSGDADESDDEDSDFAPNLSADDADDDDDEDSGAPDRPASEPDFDDDEASGSEDVGSENASDDESDGGNDVESVDMSDGEKEQMAAGAAREAPPSKRRRR